MSDMKKCDSIQNNLTTSLEMMSEADAAARLCLSRITLQRARTRGEISFYKVGRRVLYSIAQIFEYLKGLEQKSRQSQEAEGELR